MEEMEAEHGVLRTVMMCGKTEEKKIQCGPVFNWRVKKRCVQRNDPGEEKCFG